MKTILERFEAKIDKTSNTTGCWLWAASKKGFYGQFSYKSKNLYAHRVSYEIYKGPIPEGLCVCHSCDNSQCCNPDHLWLGTAKDNAVDRDAKGRFDSGFMCGKHYNQRLSIEEVLCIRRHIAQGLNYQMIMKMFGICSMTYYLIKNNRKSYNFI